MNSDMNSSMNNIVKSYIKSYEFRGTKAPDAEKLVDNLTALSGAG